MRNSCYTVTIFIVLIIMKITFISAYFWPAEFCNGGLDSQNYKALDEQKVFFGTRVFLAPKGVFSSQFNSSDADIFFYCTR